MEEIMVDSNETKSPEKAKGVRRAVSIEDEIASLQEKLRRAVDKKRRLDAEAAEKNKKAIDALLKAEKLDAVPASTWLQHVAEIKNILGSQE
jgi:hypothetical protein